MSPANLRKESPAARLAPPEIWWRDLAAWLGKRGFLLRPRYRPGWRPSWTGLGEFGVDYEDQRILRRAAIMDATRVSDGELVILKKIDKSDNPREEELTQYLCSGPVALEPRNHCIPLLDILHPPNEPNVVILVLPLLLPFYEPRFRTFGEAIDFMQQAFEGIKFLHDHLIAHRDCMFMNIMMDPKPLYPDMFHPVDPHKSRDWKGKPKHYSRTTHPTRYILIDFGISRRYRPEDMPPLEPPVWSADRTVPENIKEEPCNPFPIDIYLIANVIRLYFLNIYDGFDFISPLITDMMQDDPEKRPTIDVVIARFDQIVGNLSKWKLRSRLKKHIEWSVAGLFRSGAHIIRTASYMLRGLDPVPTPRT
ncbi:unnamed protein product [Somion occarium]|uniref:Protein kinase domain-containing protein n=1 Tax=Somion occarium TaxID=3059160 RepID=A0ABP1DEA4_9APHY